MAIEPFYIAVGELFERKYVFEVPRFQRGYAWEEAEIQDFLRDLWQCYNARVNNQQKRHFFGSMISIRREKHGSSGRHRELIDGQQRLATFVLLARSVEVALNALHSEAVDADCSAVSTMAHRKAEELRTTYRILNDEINRQPVETPRLQLSDPDRTFFKLLIEGNSVTSERHSHGLLAEALDTISGEVDELCQEQESLDARLDCLSIIAEFIQRDADVISIETDDDAEAYHIFQVVNNRGTGLTEGDLMRAATAELLGTSTLSTEAECVAMHWDQVLTAKPSRVEDFLRWYYASVIGDRPGKSSLFEDFMSEFFPERHGSSVSKAQAKGIVEKVEQLSAEFDVYDCILSGQWPFRTTRVPRWDRNRLQLLVDVLDHTLCMPLLLAAHKLGEKRFAEVTFMVERFAFRTKIISKVHPGSLQKVYHQESLKMRGNPGRYKMSTLRVAFQSVIDDKANDRHFSAALSEQLVFQPNSSSKYLKYFLMTVEEFLPWYRSRKSGQPKLTEKGRVLDAAEFTIEHVYPQSPDNNAVDASLEPLVNLLGNLTILGPKDNDSVANKPFIDKVSVFSSSAILLNQQLAKNTSWDVATLNSRSDELCAVAKKLFSFS